MIFKHIFGPVPSRRLGLSLGVSPIPESCCNYSCIYCQLGRTRNMTNTRSEFFSIEEIVNEFKEFTKGGGNFDVVSIVGEGEPTLYSGVAELIAQLKKLTDKPVVVITNGSLLSLKEVREAVCNADIVLPSIDAYDEITFKKINRPHGKLIYEDIKRGLELFSKEYKGELWLEIMLVKDINDSEKDILEYKNLLAGIKYDRLYLNTPVRPPAEENVEEIDTEKMRYAVNTLGGISMELLVSEGFYSEVIDHKEAVMSIIKRHPMNQMEVKSFLGSRGCSKEKIENIIEDLKKDKNVAVKEYKGYNTFRSL